MLKLHVFVMKVLFNPVVYPLVVASSKCHCNKANNPNNSNRHRTIHLHHTTEDHADPSHSSNKQLLYQPKMFRFLNKDNPNNQGSTNAVSLAGVLSALVVLVPLTVSQWDPLLRPQYLLPTFRL
jgi:hypothetical protein